MLPSDAASSRVASGCSYRCISMPSHSRRLVGKRPVTALPRGTFPSASGPRAVGVGFPPAPKGVRIWIASSGNASTGIEPLPTAKDAFAERGSRGQPGKASRFQKVAFAVFAISVAVIAAVAAAVLVRLTLARVGN
jgi:hypothetical protein